jgi:hypothetical protein
MISLTTALGMFGPFTSVTKVGSVWVCDGAHYPEGVIGVATQGVYVIPPEQIEAELTSAKAAKYLAIDAMREVANNTSFIYLDKDIRCGPPDRGDIDGIMGRVAMKGTLPPDWPGGWIATDGTFLEMADADAFIVFYDAMVAQGITNFEYAGSLKAIVAAATTLAEINAVVW